MRCHWNALLAGSSLALTLLAGACAQDGGSVSDTHVAGATGRTIVPGSTSTIAGDAEATSQQQKWPLTRGH